MSTNPTYSNKGPIAFYPTDRLPPHSSDKAERAMNWWLTPSLALGRAKKVTVSTGTYKTEVKTASLAKRIFLFLPAIIGEAVAFGLAHFSVSYSKMLNQYQNDVVLKTYRATLYPSPTEAETRKVIRIIIEGCATKKEIPLECFKYALTLVGFNRLEFINKLNLSYTEGFEYCYHLLRILGLNEIRETDSYNFGMNGRWTPIPSNQEIRKGLIELWNKVISLESSALAFPVALTGSEKGQLVQIQQDLVGVCLPQFIEKLLHTDLEANPSPVDIIPRDNEPLKRTLNGFCGRLPDIFSEAEQQEQQIIGYAIAEKLTQNRALFSLLDLDLQLRIYYGMLHSQQNEDHMGEIIAQVVNLCGEDEEKLKSFAQNLARNKNITPFINLILKVLINRKEENIEVVMASFTSFFHLWDSIESEPLAVWSKASLVLNLFEKDFNPQIYNVLKEKLANAFGVDQKLQILKSSSRNPAQATFEGSAAHVVTSGGAIPNENRQGQQASGDENVRRVIPQSNIYAYLASPYPLIRGVVRAASYFISSPQLNSSESSEGEETENEDENHVSAGVASVPTEVVAPSSSQAPVSNAQGAPQASNGYPQTPSDSEDENDAEEMNKPVLEYDSSDYEPGA